MLRRLIDANLSGLGFGVGFGFKSVPDSMIALAEEHDFPLFEVPYNIPFIAITEAVASKIVNEQYSLLQRSLAVHEKLTKIVLEEKGLQFIISTLSALVGCSAVLFDFHGLVLCEAAHRRRIPAELIADLWRQISDKRASRQDFAAEAPHGAGGSVQVYPVVASHRIGAFLAVIKDGGEFSDYDRIILHHVVTVTALELVKKKAVAETEKRLAGDFFDELIASDLYEEEIARRLAFFGLEPGAEQLIMLVDIDGFKAFADGACDKEQAVQDVKERLHWAVDEFLAQRDLLFISASHSDAVIVLVQLGQRTPHDMLALAAELRGTIGGMISEVTVSVGIGRPHRLLVDLRQSYYEALYAIQIRKLKGSTSVIASFDDLGSYGLLLGLQDTVSLEVFYDSVLGKLHEYDEANASDLVKSLACFLEANGHWGEGRRAPLRAPPHAALPHETRRRHHRARPGQLAGPHGVLAGPQGPRAHGPGEQAPPRRAPCVKRSTPEQLAAEASSAGARAARRRRLLEGRPPEQLAAVDRQVHAGQGVAGDHKAHRSRDLG